MDSTELPGIPGEPKGSQKYWYNLTTGKVEKGFESPAMDRAGPFDTAEEASHALEIMRERSRAWAEDDAREAGWGSSTATGDTAE